MTTIPSITCDLRRDFTTCGVCFVEDGTIKMLAFRSRVANTSDGLSVALCHKCRHETLSVLAAEIAEEPDREEIDVGMWLERRGLKRIPDSHVTPRQTTLTVSGREVTIFLQALCYYGEDKHGAMHPMIAKLRDKVMGAWQLGTSEPSAQLLGEAKTIDLDDLEQKARAAINEIDGPPETYFIPSTAAAPFARRLLALITCIRELRAGLADALYWLKPGLDCRMDEMATDRDDLSKLLDKEIEVP